MRIALLAPLVSPLAPPFLGGAQALLYDLAAGLASRGHDIALYAADGSHVPGVRIIPTGIDSAQFAAERIHPSDRGAPVPTRRANIADLANLADLADTPMARAIARVYDLIASHAGEHDLLHAHAYDWAAFAYAARQPLPVVHTLHLPNLDPEIGAALAEVSPWPTPPPAPPPQGEGGRGTPPPAPPPQGEGGRGTPPPAPPLAWEGRGEGEGEQRRVHLATVSRACAATYAGTCRIEAVLYNGIAVERIPFRSRPANPPYLLCAGRISPEKGTADAMAIAERAGRHLLIAGGVYDTTYYAEQVAPRLDQPSGPATYVGEVGRERLWELMAGAEAVLCPVAWEEPFGLVACEAQATGTPVVAYARGALGEVVAHGRSGWLVPPGDVAAAAEAVRRAGEIDRRTCRGRVERRFGLASMLDAHEAHYARVLGTA